MLAGWVPFTPPACLLAPLLRAPQLIGHLRKQMPTMFVGEKKQKKMMEDIIQNFEAVQREYHLPRGDFPDPYRYA